MEKEIVIEKENTEKEILLEKEPIVTGGTDDYSSLNNKPKINSVELDGNKSLKELGIAGVDDIPETYTLPTASSETLGGIKIGGGLEINENGVVKVLGTGNSPVIEVEGGTSTDPLDFKDIFQKDGIYHLKGYFKMSGSSSVQYRYKDCDVVAIITSNKSGSTIYRSGIIFLTKNGDKYPAMEIDIIQCDSWTSTNPNWIITDQPLVLKPNTSYTSSSTSNYISNYALYMALTDFVSTSLSSNKLTNLKTTLKTSLVGAINELADRIDELETKLTPAEDK